MNILLVTKAPKAGHQGIGGVETQMQMVAEELARRQHRVQVVSDNEADTNYGELPVHHFALSSLDRWSLRARHLLPRRYRKLRSPVAYQVFRWVYLPKLRRLVRGSHVVHTLKDSAMCRVAGEAARIEGVPLLVSPYVHPGPNGHLSPQIVERAEFFKGADAVFALLETDREILVRLGVPNERIRAKGVVPLVPDKTDASDFRSRHGLGDKPVVLYVGRVEQYKGVVTLLDAAPQVWRDLPDVHFVFVGPAAEQSRKWFDGRDKRIRYLGPVSEQEKGNAFAACDLFCMPSRAEILPAVYLEAWSYGKATIGGTAHGLRELIVENGAGTVVEQDPAILAVEIVELLRDEKRRHEMGERGRALLTRRFSKEALVRSIEETYEDLLRVRERSGARRTGS